MTMVQVMKTGWPLDLTVQTLLVLFVLFVIIIIFNLVGAPIVGMSIRGSLGAAATPKPWRQKPNVKFFSKNPRGDGPDISSELIAAISASPPARGR